jgi:hypothetical protein
MNSPDRLPRAEVPGLAASEVLRVSVRKRRRGPAPTFDSVTLADAGGSLVSDGWFLGQ